MTLRNRILASLAAGGLLVSQSVSAAALPARTSSAVGVSERLAPAALPAVALITILLVIFGIMAITDDDDNGFPTSP